MLFDIDIRVSSQISPGHRVTTELTRSQVEAEDLVGAISATLRELAEAEPDDWGIDPDDWCDDDCDCDDEEDWEDEDSTEETVAPGRTIQQVLRSGWTDVSPEDLRRAKYTSLDDITEPVVATPKEVPELTDGYRGYDELPPLP